MKLYKLFISLLFVAFTSFWVYNQIMEMSLDIVTISNYSTFNIKVNNCTMDLNTSLITSYSFQKGNPAIPPTLSKFYVYSAFFDVRNKAQIVVVAMIEGNVGELFCVVVFSNNQSNIVAAYVISIAENEGLRYTASLIICPLDHVQEPRFVSVLRSKCEEVSNLLRVTVIPIKTVSSHIAVCIPPINNDYDNVDQMLETISVNQALGAAHFVLYNHSIGPNVSRLLAELFRTKVVTILPFRPPMARNEIKYFGQMAAIQDCLYRTMGYYDHVAFCDLDEYMVPRRHRDWHHLIADKPSVGAYLFRNAWFPTNWPNDPIMEANATFKELRAMSLLKLRRSRAINNAFERSKLIVNPLKISVMGIHNVWRFVLGGQYHILTPEEGLNQHYRGGSDFQVKDSIPDNGILRLQNPIVVSLLRNRRILGRNI